MTQEFKLVRGSVIDQDVDIIVNAANARLRGGGGIDGAIHNFAGPDLLAYLKEQYPNPIKAGEVALTSGFNLPQSIIHAPGPVWIDGESGESDALASVYTAILSTATLAGAKTIAFCSISTGIYGYPLEEACDIALSTIFDWFKVNETSIETIVFAMFGEQEFQVYQEKLNENRA